jgi:1-acyl-sn-glycerol-3-phosphate acyltransferase
MVYAVTYFVLKPLLRLLYRPVVEGTEKVPLTGPLIFASNHLSVIDSVVIPLVSPRRVFYLAKAEYFEAPGLRGAFVRRLFTALGSIPVQRSSSRAAQDALAQALWFLSQGYAFGIYPEGTRSRDGRLYRGRTGVGWLALNAGAPVVPIGVVGTDKMQPVGTRFPRLARITVRFGDPLVFDDLGGLRPAEARRQVTEAVMDGIAALSGQERADTYNTLPADTDL